MFQILHPLWHSIFERCYKANSVVDENKFTKIRIAHDIRFTENLTRACAIYSL